MGYTRKSGNLPDGGDTHVSSTAILWSFDSGDSVGDSAAESKALYAKAARSYPKAQIGLNHETYGSTVREVIPYALKVCTSSYLNQ